MATKTILVMQLLAAVCYGSNIDILQPILRMSPDTFQNDSLFGYSLSLHQIAAVTASNFQMAMDNTRIVVSAPKRIPEGGQMRTGAVYVCPVAPGPCVRSSHARLYDIEGNTAPENKTNQFLGASMASDGANLVVCAHRYNFATSNDRVITGRCFASSSRDLSTFTDLQPCREVDSRSPISAGFCQAGTSAVVLPGPVYGLGAPGYYGWRGNIISMTSNDAANIQRFSFNEGTQATSDLVNYLGYATTAGYFSVTTRQDYAVSVPRFGLYSGAVHIVLRDNGLSLVSQSALRGSQTGEGYGFSVLAANLAGDGLSELLVGSPYYHAGGALSDAGRVFVYSNRGGSLSQQRVIVGTQADARFGYAMANMGDINGDGYDDIAISAPFSSTGESGTIYLYYGSNTQGLSLTPQQTIVGSSLSLSGVSPFTGFGSTLASGIDVDGNTYNDLVVGSFESQKVFLLRTRPVAQTTTTFTATPQIVDLDSFPCTFGSLNYACFVLEACAEYSGNGLSNQLTYEFNVTADTRSMEKRIFFDSMTPTALANRSVSIGNRMCQSFTAYILNGTQDRFNTYTVSFGLRVPQPAINQGDGNLALQQFDDYPVLQLTGTTELQVQPLQDCNGTICIPDLRIRVLSTSTTKTDGSVQAMSDTIIAGGVRSAQIELEVVNSAEDAFQASVSITIPSQLEFGRVTGTFNTANTVTLTCSIASRDETTMTSSTTCSIGNPFRGPGMRVVIMATVMPQRDLRGDEGDLTVSFTANSLNPENATTVDDGSNMDSVTLKTAAEADISLDTPGVVSPEQLAYSRMPPNGSINSVTDLGPTFSVSFVVRNTGPSTVRNIKLVIWWPLNGSNTGDFYYLYPAQFSTSETGATISCSNENINPNRTLTLANNDDGSTENTGTTTGGKRRRKRSASSHHSIRKRQNIAVPADSVTDTTEQSTVNQTISCANAGAVLNCVPIECTIIGLQGSTNSRARVNIIGYIDQRFFSTSVDRYSIIPNATISIVGDDFVRQPNPTTGKTATATVRLIPAEVAILGERRAVPWWVIVLPIVAALIIIAVVAVILWALGFFKRKKHAEIKQKKEEMENLEEHGVTAGIGSAGGSTDNIIAS